MSKLSELSPEEKRKVNIERKKAVAKAWEKEKNLVLKGQGTRDWTQKQQLKLIETNKIAGYDGHHMKSVSNFPEYTGKTENIQFLTIKEHYKGAHQGNILRNSTNGYYDPVTKKTEEFKQDELRPVESKKLSNPICKNNIFFDIKNEENISDEKNINDFVESIKDQNETNRVNMEYANGFVNSMKNDDFDIEKDNKNFEKNNNSVTNNNVINKFRRKI